MNDSAATPSPTPSAPPSKLRAWGRLLRLPNLFSVPGDPIAGFLLAGGASSSLFRAPSGAVAPVWIGLVSIFLYMAGLLSNDLADFETDRRERPGRPLPSGAISKHAAWCAFSLCILWAAIPISLFPWPVRIVAILLLSSILAYNFKFKNRPFLGPFFMGLCRFWNVVLGIAIIPAEQSSFASLVAPSLFALGVFLYIFGISRAAQKETETLPKRPGGVTLLAGAVICYGTLFGIVVHHPTRDWYTLLSGGISAILSGVFLLFAYWAYRVFRLFSTPRETQQWIGRLIGLLILLQGAVCGAVFHLEEAVAFLLAAAAAKKFAKHYYGS